MEPERLASGCGFCSSLHPYRKRAIRQNNSAPRSASDEPSDKSCNELIHLDNNIANRVEGVVAAESKRGRGSAVTLLPLFRSQTQALLLTRLLLGPGEESLTDLAVAVGAYKNAIKHEVDRLEAAGLVSSRQVGRSRLVSVSAEEPIRSILLDLVLHTYGPVHVVGEELSGVSGITAAFIYGSWAARYAREPGPPPGDVDVLVVGDPDRDDLFEAIGRVTALLGKEVNVHVVTEAAWSKPKGAFLAGVKANPLAVVPLDDALAGEAS